MSDYNRDFIVEQAKKAVAEAEAEKRADEEKAIFEAMKLLRGHLRMYPGLIDFATIQTAGWNNTFVALVAAPGLAEIEMHYESGRIMQYRVRQYVKSPAGPSWYPASDFAISCAAFTVAGGLNEAIVMAADPAFADSKSKVEAELRAWKAEQEKEQVEFKAEREAAKDPGVVLIQPGPIESKPGLSDSFLLWLFADTGTGGAILRAVMVVMALILLFWLIGALVNGAINLYEAIQLAERGISL